MRKAKNRSYKQIVKGLSYNGQDDQLLHLRPSYCRVRPECRQGRRTGEAPR